MYLKNLKRKFKWLVASAIVLEVILVVLIITWFALRQRPMESMLCFNDESYKSAGWKSEILQNLTLGYDKDATQNEYCFETVDALNAFVRQNAKRTFKALVASAIVLEVILVTLIIKWYALRQRPMESRLCFNDESLKSAGWKSEILQNLTLAYGKDTTQNGKCFKTIEMINNFVMQQMTFRYNTKINPEPLIFDLTTLNCTISSAKPGILILTDIKLVHAPDMSELGKEPNIFWTAVSKQGKGLNYLEEEGMIAIQTTGYFFVTSQLSFLKENKTNSDEIGKHRVIHISNKTGQQSILLESTRSRCEMPAKQCEQTSFIAAAFKFEENDKMFVTVSHKFQILSGNGTHFFSVVEI